MGQNDRRRFKYQFIFDELQRLVSGGRYQVGDRLPTELQLARQYDVSRPTVTRALNALQHQGLIERRPGSGSYVAKGGHGVRDNRLFGLLIPGLGKGEIFEPICAQIAAVAEANDFSLLWSGSHVETKEAATVLLDVAQRYIENEVSGVFLEPLEHSSQFAVINRQLVELLEEAGIPIVLIDSDYVPFPYRSRYDLVGIDNFRSGYLVAQHFLQHGAQRVDFLARPYSAYTVSIRLRGYRAALLDHDIVPADDWVHFGDPEDESFVDTAIRHSGARYLICGNDATAAALMPALDRLGLDVPGKLAIAGFDDIQYASMLRVPLTTFHQPVREIGTVAIDTMLWRLENPAAPARTVFTGGELIIRDSCGFSGGGG